MRLLHLFFSLKYTSHCQRQVLLVLVVAVAVAKESKKVMTAEICVFVRVFDWAESKSCCIAVQTRAFGQL